MKRRTFIAGTAAALSAARYLRTPLLAAEETLRAAAAAKGIVYGANFRDVELIESDANFAALTQEQCALIEAGRSFQWRQVHPTATNFNFKETDAFVNWASSHGMRLSECHLAWHLGAPKWLSNTLNEQNWRDILTNHIKTVAGRYAGKMYSWVVVNEALAPKDRRPDGLRESFWVRAAGPEFLDVAFQTAAAADPRAILVYNDDGFEADTPANVRKRSLALSLFEGMLKRGVPIHAVGIEAHLRGKPDGFSAPGLSKFISDAGSLGLKVFITEFEVGDDELAGDLRTRDALLAKNYAGFLNTVLPNKNVTTIITWSLANKYHWRNDWRPDAPTKRSDGTPRIGMPFGYSLEKTAVFDAFLQAFNSAPAR